LESVTGLFKIKYMRTQVWCQTDVGLRRENNQDSFLVDENTGLFIVADGMGGHKGGEVASTLAIETVRNIVIEKKNISSVSDVLRTAYRVASRKIFEKSQREEDLSGMGTTVVLLYCINNTAYIANVGDSRAYLFFESNLWQLTEDHSLMNEQLKAGLLREDEVDHFIGRNVITRSVGYEEDVFCDVLEQQIDKPCYYLLCSDGLSGLVSDQRLCEILRQHPADQAVDQCVKEAKANGGDDNVTVMLVKVTP
jgi:serine/threonine protein phosphatase PrpC